MDVRESTAIFGRYALSRRIGIGGMAEVWKATVSGPAGFRKVVAIKRVLPEYAEDPASIEMFVEEAKLVARLVHPNIVQVFDFGCVGHEYFIAMEYVAGSNLSRFLQEISRRQLQLPAEVAYFVALEAVKGLRAAHEKTDLAGNPIGLIHRDVSPHNILVSYDGEVKVGDFGIAKLANATSRTVDGQVRGKLAYMSPEQANAQALDYRTDLFSLGLILYELVTGKRLFTAGTTDRELYAQVAAFDGLTGDALDAVPTPLRALLVTALHPAPEGRFQEARALERALGENLSLDGARLARESLAALVRRLFESDLLAELVSDLPQGTGAEPGPAPGAEREMDEETELGTGLDADAWEMARARGVALDDTSSGIEALMDTVASADVRETDTNTAETVLRPAFAPAFSPPPVARPAGERDDRALRAGRGSAPDPDRALRAGRGSAPDPDRLLPAVKRWRPTVRATLSLGLLSIALFVGSSMLGSRWVGSRAPQPDIVEVPAADVPIGGLLEAGTVPAIAIEAGSEPTPAEVATPTGTLEVTASPWVEIWIDDRRIGKGTPLREYAIEAGRHTLRFVNARRGIVLEKKVTVREGQRVTLHVSGASKTVRDMS